MVDGNKMQNYFFQKHFQSFWSNEIIHTYIISNEITCTAKPIKPRVEKFVFSREGNNAMGTMEAIIDNDIHATPHYGKGLAIKP